MKKTISIILILAFLTSGCANTLRVSPTYYDNIKKIKTIAVMPPDIKVYKLTTGGMRELMDEWTESAKVYARAALEKHLAQRHEFEIKFINEDWLEQHLNDVWKKNKALYNAVAISALLHAYPGENRFKSKAKVFEYTLGKDIEALSDALDVDALLFVYGYDHDASAGRTALWLLNFMVGVYTGVMILPSNPSAMMLGLVDGKTGALEWFKTSPANMEYKFKSEKHMDVLVEWLTRYFVMEK